MLTKIQFIARALIFLVLIGVGVVGAQKVATKKNALQDVPLDKRESLVSRTSSFIRAVNVSDLDSLLDLLHPRAKNLIDLVDARKKIAQGWRPEEQIIDFKIFSVVRADEDDYTDEPKPKPEEGWKWFVNGCAKVSINNKKPKKYDYGFNVWLVDGKWFVRRHGFGVDGGGYKDCKF